MRMENKISIFLLRVDIGGRAFFQYTPSFHESKLLSVFTSSFVCKCFCLCDRKREREKKKILCIWGVLGDQMFGVISRNLSDSVLMITPVGQSIFLNILFV